MSSTGGVFKTANVLLALGRRGSPRKLEVPGEEQSKVVYRVIEPEVFEGQHVLVVGWWECGRRIRVCAGRRRKMRVGNDQLPKERLCKVPSAQSKAHRS